jgi:hypothetical protein
VAVIKSQNFLSGDYMKALTVTKLFFSKDWTKMQMMTSLFSSKRLDKDTDDDRANFSSQNWR